jgi:hypothetical protein
MKTNTLLTFLVAATLCHFIPGASRATDAAPATPRHPRDVISETIRADVGRKLKDAGAAYAGLQVAVAADRDSATPFKVSYQGLRHFQGADGTAPAADGDFIMEYIGGGQWQGKLAGTQFTVPVGKTDNIDLPFVDDPAVLGEWKSVDFVADIADFKPEHPGWQGKLFLPGLTFKANGKTAMPWLTWTKGYVLHQGDQTASRYEIREIQGARYLFFEWKSGDVTIAGMKPHYYVLQKAGN